MERFAKSLTVRDLGLAAALAAYHVPPDPRGFEDHFDLDGRRYHCWHFMDRATHTNELTVDLIAAWQSPDEWNAKHPAHPWAYIMIAFRNKEHLRERCTRNAPKYLICRGQSFAIVDPAASRDAQEKILTKIGI